MQNSGQGQMDYLAGTRCPRCGRPKQSFILNGGGQIYACGQCDNLAIQQAELKMQDYRRQAEKREAGK